MSIWFYKTVVLYCNQRWPNSSCIWEKDGEAYIILTQEEGLVFKVAFNQLRKKKNLLLKSLNTIYQPYELHLGDIREVWKFCNYISNEMPDASMQKNTLLTKIGRIADEIGQLRTALK